MTLDSKERAEAVERLLSLGRNDAPPAGSLEREAARLGLVGANFPAQPELPGGAASTTAESAKFGLSIKLATVVGIGLAAVGAVWVTSYRSSVVASPLPETTEASPQAAIAPSAPFPQVHAAITAPAETVAAAPPASSPSPMVNRNPARPRVPANAPTPTSLAVPTSSSPSPSSATLADELARLERARMAARKNPDLALTTLDAHAREYPATQFREESIVIRVEALLAAGRRRDAERVADPVLQARSDAPVAQRLRDLLTAN